MFRDRKGKQSWKRGPRRQRRTSRMQGHGCQRRVQRSPWQRYLGNSHLRGEQETSGEGMGEHRWQRLAGDAVGLDTWRNVAVKERKMTRWEGNRVKMRLFLARRDPSMLQGSRKKPVQSESLVAQGRTTYLGVGSRTSIKVCWWTDRYSICTG